MHVPGIRLEVGLLCILMGLGGLFVTHLVRLVDDFCAQHSAMCWIDLELLEQLQPAHEVSQQLHTASTQSQPATAHSQHSKSTSNCTASCPLYHRHTLCHLPSPRTLPSPLDCYCAVKHLLQPVSLHTALCYMFSDNLQQKVANALPRFNKECRLTAGEAL